MISESKRIRHKARGERLGQRAAGVILGACLVQAVGLASGLQAEDYIHIDGELALVTIHWPGGSTGETRRQTNHLTIPFTCITGIREWALEGGFVRNGTSLWVFDGTNVYHKMQITAPRHSSGKEASGSQDSERLPPPTVRIYPDNVRYAGGTEGERIVWLAFCSGGYLRQPDRVVPLPVAASARAVDVFGYADETETFADELGLPRSVKFVTSRSLYEQSARRFEQEELRGARRVPRGTLPDGRLKFEYRVTAWTNIGGWHIPLRFVFRQGLPTKLGYAWVLHHGEGRVKAIASTHTLPSVWEDEDHPLVVDRRFRSSKRVVDGIVYSGEVARTLPTNDARLQKRFAETERRARAPVVVRRRRAALSVAVLLGVAALVPLARRLARRRRKG